MEEQKPHADHSYSQITEYVFLGYNMNCCEIHFNVLRNLGITADINIEGENKEEPHDIKVHMWLPTPEHEAPTLTQLHVGARAIETLVERKQKTYVHCEKGHVRSAIMLGAYLVLTGMSSEDALAFIKEKRDVIHPQDIHIKALKEFENSLN